LRKFLWGGVVVIRQDVRCPVCGSLERHRLAWAFFQRRTDLFQGQAQRMLHVAPEPEFARRLARTPGLDYVSADLLDPAAMVQIDLMEIPFPDESFDCIYCSHVLEHVADDRRAMRELYRVLRTGGWAVLQVPITVEVTFEDPAITDPAERVRYFGQADHVRAYGPDYEDRLAAAGFQVTKVPGAEFLAPAEIDRLRIDTTESIFYCRKD
jgi:SAM-dependent methyltransferase